MGLAAADECQVPPFETIAAASREDTIVAPATPAGRAAIGMLRLSGSRAATIVRSLVPGRRFPPRVSTLGRLVDADGALVDQVLVTVFPASASYTGEDVAEISCHGSPPVVRFAVQRTLELGARLAEPGEFTRRAFHNGRMDLVQAEAVRDLIEASTLYQARVAARQTTGALSGKVVAIKAQLVELISVLEAGIDFAEDDVEVASEEEILGRLSPVRQGIAALAEGFTLGRVVRAGLRLAIVGRPNVGKSSLFNRLLQRDRAIVNPAAGTTRDSISEAASFDGIPVELVDTAGIRATVDAIESEGVERTWRALQEADCALVVVDLSEPESEWDRSLWERASTACPTLLVGNKCDLTDRYGPDPPTLRVSAKTGDGVRLLRDRVREQAVPGLDAMHEGTFVTSIRQERLLQVALGALAKAEDATRQRVPHEMLLLDLYESLVPLDEITGGTTVEDILDRIFSTFCIGK